MKPLHSMMRRVSADYAAASNQLRQGITLTAEVIQLHALHSPDNEHANTEHTNTDTPNTTRCIEIHITPVDLTPDDAHRLPHYQTPAGIIGIADLLPLLQAISPIALTSDDVEHTSLYRALALAHLDSKLHACFGELSPVSTNTQTLKAETSKAHAEASKVKTVIRHHDVMCCVYRQSDQHCLASTRMRLPSDTLTHWLNTGTWQALPAPPYYPSNTQRSITQRAISTAWLARQTLQFPLIVGKLDLPLDLNTRQCQHTIHIGDVLMITDAAFSVTGEGTLYLPLNAHTQHVVRTRWLASHQLSVIDVQTNQPQDEDMTHTAEANTDTSTIDTSSDAINAIANINLPLNVQLGSVTLSVEQLSQLTAGMLLSIDGCAPGEAHLCHRQQTVARGELVDVEGKLGLQITAIEVDHAD